MADQAWWSSRFLALIEGMSPPEPLRAGRALARTEAVLSVRRSGNLVVAMVRDQNEDLHKTRLAVRTFGDMDWGRIERALASQARYAAALLAGSMPADVEDAFAVLGLSLLPTRADDLAMDCTCADWQRPCAHLVAACHRLGESIDLDAFALLALRGRERDAVLAGIRRLRPASASRPGGGTHARSGGWPWGSPAQPGDGTAGDTLEPLPSSPAAFWTAPAPDGGSDVRSEAPARPDVLLDLCGPLVVEPLGDLRDELRPAYAVFAAGRASAARPDGSVEE
ncbi:SWIM zinc finger family protein [Pseudofrankia inefficax]|uniref:SWIM-type domain-containing protein n=1 Tax=Pseudofrankia inefficax (strain DSM 45817 / CECT 9037 / DDB 130130 / EuI1c) TaxID=298654 RepID=E3J5J8_PSEI1|nr:hypothetical protein [Pseudofrankia inefficax]ADP81942.1 hypothetical protein FraEuI1c_3936 [Pseudofrankia inefficax]